MADAGGDTHVACDPKYNMTYRGAKVLDLGFGAAPGAAAAANTLSWDNMRKARPRALCAHCVLRRGRCYGLRGQSYLVFVGRGAARIQPHSHVTWLSQERCGVCLIVEACVPATGSTQRYPAYLNLAFQLFLAP